MDYFKLRLVVGELITDLETVRADSDATRKTYANIMNLRHNQIDQNCPQRKRMLELNTLKQKCIEKGDTKKLKVLDREEHLLTGNPNITFKCEKNKVVNIFKTCFSKNV